MNLSNDEIDQLYAAIPVIQAQEAMSSLKVQDWPNTKASARNKIGRDLYKQAYPSILRGEPKALTPEEMAQIFNGG